MLDLNVLDPATMYMYSPGQIARTAYPRGVGQDALRVVYGTALPHM